MPRNRRPPVNPLSETAAWEIIRKAVDLDNGSVRISFHAKERMAERGITVRQVLRVLSCKSSSMSEGPFQAPNGDWKCTVEGASAGVIVRVPLAIVLPVPGSDIVVISVITL